MSDYRRALTSDGLDEFVWGTAGADTLDGGAGNDWLYGGAGADTYVMRPGSGHDVIVGFETGEDVLSLHNLSPRTVSVHDTDAGMLITMGGLGAGGPESVLLWGVHAVAPSDFVFA